VQGLSFINKLRPVTYNLDIHRQNEICGILDNIQWEGKYDIETIRHSGFIAQEVEEAAIASGYDFNGVVATRNNAKLYSVQYAAFVVALVKAVQELSEENQNLKEENKDIRAEINELKAMVDKMESRIDNN
jgi:ABC-type oligopeptide transport system ATPase subunit